MHFVVQELIKFSEKPEPMILSLSDIVHYKAQILIKKLISPSILNLNTIGWQIKMLVIQVAGLKPFTQIRSSSLHFRTVY